MQVKEAMLENCWHYGLEVALWPPLELWNQMLCCLSSIGVVLTQLPEGLEESSSLYVRVLYISRKYRLGTGFRKAKSHCWRKAPGARDQRSKPAIGKAGPEIPATKSVQWALSQHVCMGGRVLRQ